MLTRRERNEIFETIARTGANVADFDLGDENIWHRGAVSSFLRWRESGGSYFYEFRVEDGPDTGEIPHQARSWPELQQAISTWASEVDYVSTTPDYWEHLHASRELLGNLDRSTNAPFTASELAEIDRHIEAARADYHATDELTAEQIEVIDQKLDQILEASRRIGRKDWVMLVLGAVASLAVSASVPPPGLIQSLAWTVLGGLAHLFGMPGLPPALPA